MEGLKWDRVAAVIALEQRDHVAGPHVDQVLLARGLNPAVSPIAIYLYTHIHTYTHTHIYIHIYIYI